MRHQSCCKPRERPLVRRATATVQAEVWVAAQQLDRLGDGGAARHGPRSFVRVPAAGPLQRAARRAAAEAVERRDERAEQRRSRGGCPRRICGRLSVGCGDDGSGDLGVQRVARSASELLRRIVKHATATSDTAATSAAAAASATTAGAAPVRDNVGVPQQLLRRIRRQLRGPRGQHLAQHGGQLAQRQQAVALELDRGARGEQRFAGRAPAEGVLQPLGRRLEDAEQFLQRGGGGGHGRR